MASLLSFGKRIVHDVTHNPITNAVGAVEKPVAHAIAQAPQYANPVGAIQGIGQAIGAAAPHIPTFSNSSPLRFANQAVIKPIQTTGIHIGQAASGQNPYHGSFGQQLGQAGQDALTLGSALPIGRGAEIAAKGAPLLTKIGQGAKFGAKAGGGFGAAQGLTQSLQHKANLEQTLKNTGINTLAGVGLGLAGGVAAPVIGSGVRAGIKAADSRIPLNAVGAIGKDVNKSPALPPPKPPLPKQATPGAATKSVKLGAGQGSGAKSEQILRDLGASKQDIPKLIQQEKDQQAAIQSRQVTQPTAGLGPLPKGVKDQLKAPQFKRTAPENSQLNPTKVTIPEVQPGNYEQARINPQLASNPIDFATSQAVKAAQRLSKEEQRNIPHLVENPSLATSKTAKEFIARHNQLTNLTHATSQGLGGNTNFVPNYFRHAVDLSNPEDAARWEELVAKRGGAAADPYSFGGIDNYNRVFKNVKDLQAAGFHLKNENNPIQNIIDYGKSSSNTLRKQALLKGFTDADMQAGPKLENYNLRDGSVIPLSERGKQEIQGYEQPAKPNKVHAGYRIVNRKAKQTLLSASEFHALNIGPKVSSTLALEGHPVLGAKGLYGTFRSQLGRKYSDKLQQSYATDLIPATTSAGKGSVTTVEAGARLGSPIKFGSDYANEGKLDLGKAGFGEKTIFEKSMPALHGRAIQAAVKDLNKRGISLDSPEAHALGTRINEMMGFINTEARNLNQGHQRGLSDITFAPQFTRAKWATLKSALKDTRLNNKSLAGSYARRAVIANAAADFVFITGVGYALNQKSDNIRDLMLRAIFAPAVPTPLKDSKGNTIQLKTPASYSSEALGLVVTLERGKDGHLTPKFEPSKVGGNVVNYGRNRLAIIPSNALKVATNTNYAGKPLYDPNAKFGTQVEQGATTVASGLLPIGGQGITQTNAVKKHLPGNIQDVINANTPGANPLLKSVGSSFGLTPTTDKTVGKGLQTDQYFSALSDAKKGLNSHEKDVLDLYAGSKKNPVTGKYDVKPNSNDTQAKARALLDQPKVIDNIIALNKNLAGKGQPTDPLWQQSKDKITSVLQYQAMPPGGPDRTHWQTQNGDWYNPLSDRRTAFFNSLPKADPNKPQQPIEYPTASPSVAAAQKQFFDITDSKQRAQFLQDNPDVQKQLDAQVTYNNKMRQATGYSALDTYPTASPDVQKIIDAYNAIPKGGGKKGGNLYRSQWIQSHPNEYAAMTQYFTQSSLFGLQKDAGQAQFKDTGFSQKGLKDIYNLGQYDIGKQTDANGNTLYALGAGGSNSKFGSYARKPHFSVKLAKAKKISSPRGIKVKKLGFKAAKTRKLPVSKMPKVA